MRYDPKNPALADRDRFILSKGHCIEGYLYALADCGFFPKEELKTFCQFGTRLIGHPNRDVPGIEMNTGALGPVSYTHLFLIYQSLFPAVLFLYNLQIRLIEHLSPWSHKEQLLPGFENKNLASESRSSFLPPLLPGTYPYRCV